MDGISGRFVTETFDHDGGRAVTAYVPPEPAAAVVFCGDGQSLARWGADLEGLAGPPTLVVGVHRLPDETQRLHEYSPGVDPERFAAHGRFVVDVVRSWASSALHAPTAVNRTAVLGVSAGGELALALGLRHPDVFGTILCASPGAGFRPTAPLPRPIPRTYLVAGDREPFFAANAARWARALRAAGADVVLAERAGGHGDPFWRQEFPAMVAWAFGG